MSNLYKSSSIANTSVESRVIDSNERVMSRLEAIKEAMLQDTQPAGLVEDEDGFVEGIDATKVEELVSEEELIDNARNKAVDIINDAHLQSKKIIEEARAEAEKIKEQAHIEGYEEGSKQAIIELDKHIASKNKEYDELKKNLEEDYENMRKELEPQLVETLLTVFTKVTHTMADANRDTILHLVDSVMRNTEISKHFLIKVSKEDYQFMLNSKEKLYEHVSKNVSIEIYQDSNLKRNQCIIETDAGVFDCSLDIQLENLVKELRILSCLAE